jgi:sugar O-acyltransferase (sialic acid O-acetyltransferase NeuD family)
VLWGAGGHAKVLRECMDSAGLELVATFDNNPETPSPFSGIPLFVGQPGFLQWAREWGADPLPGFLIAIGGGKGRDRLELHQWLLGHKLPALVAIHPASVVSPSAVIGEGSHVLASATVGTEVRVGRQCIVNTSASIDHECVLEDGVHVGPGAVLSGCVHVEREAFIGSGAVVLPRIRIGRGAVVGAGAVIIKDVPAGVTAVGNPARYLTRRGA